MTKYLGPSPKFSACDANGIPLSGGLIYVYNAGTTTLADTYSDSTGSLNASPIVLDTLGAGSLWLTPGINYDIEVRNSASDLIWTAHDVTGVVTPSSYFAGLMTSADRATLFTTVVGPGGTITGALNLRGATLEWAAALTITSQPVATPIGAALSNNITINAATGATLVAVGTSAVMSSTNGTAWTARTPAENNQWRSVAYSSSLGLFAAVSLDGTNRVMTSPTGVTWTARAAAEANEWMDITWSDSLALFVAVAQTGTNRVMTSTNGTAWVARSAAEANQWQRVRFSPSLSLFVAVAYDGTHRVMTSPDGTNWTARNAAAPNHWYGLAWSDSLGLFAASSSDGTIPDKIMTSPDGINWTSRSSASNVIYIAGAWSYALSKFAFCAQDGTGGQKVATSANGTSWADQGTIATNSFNGICWSDNLGMFVAVSSDGVGNRVVTSTNGIVWTAQTSVDSTWISVIASA